MISEKTKLEIQDLLLGWYQDHARDLPWRKTRDPYLIWVSEIMLQQTRVETVIPYFNRWVARFPTLQDLAQADQDEILSLWEGLGYYHRALNLHQAVREVRSSYGGIPPDDPQELQKLPGIGRYTAGAICSIAFNLPTPILDGNIRRVFCRFFNISSPIQAVETERELWSIAGDLVPEEQPGDFNQALMELGALICLPKNPFCESCPLKAGCAANQLSLQDKLPVRKPKSPLPHLQVTAAVFLKKGRVLLAKRPPGGLLGGMWEYPGGKQEKNETLPETLSREIQEELNVGISVEDQLGTFKHAYTHYQVTLHAYHCRLHSEQFQLHYHNDLAWVPLASLGEYPMGKLDRMISNQLLSGSFAL